MSDREHWRPFSIGARLSAEEYALLCSVRDALRLTVRDIFLIGLRRARRILAEERRKQRGNGQ